MLAKVELDRSQLAEAYLCERKNAPASNLAAQV